MSDLSGWSEFACYRAVDNHGQAIANVRERD